MNGKTKLAGILGSGMVIQRDEPFKIWGSDEGVSEVTILFEGKEYKGEVKDNKFCVELPSHEAATELKITVKGSSEIELDDICFGDVFMLAGQSNMELPVGRTLDKTQEEVAASDYPYIRQYRLTPQYRLDESKEAELLDLKWTKAVKDEILEMSATGFFTAKEIYDKIKVPIGLVLNAQGGSTLEAWMPRDLLSKYQDQNALIDKFMEDNSLQKFLDDITQSIIAWRNSITEEGSEQRALKIPDDCREVVMPQVMLEKDGNGFTGSKWLYKTVDIDVEPTADSFLYVGELIDADQTYINGKLVGRTEYCYPPRKYPFDGSILKKGENLIAVRLEVNDQNGGFLKDHPYYLRTGGKKFDIEGTWYESIEIETVTPCPRVIMGQTIPTALYTASIKPILNLKFKGMWWYQGESNAEFPDNENIKPGTLGPDVRRSYDVLFKEMIERLRSDFNQKLPLVLVQMPDYVNPVTGLGEGWIKIQEMQKDAPSMVSDCKVALAKDLGESYDLHPQRKSELGKRMAKEVIDLIYN